MAKKKPRRIAFHRYGKIRAKQVAEAGPESGTICPGCRKRGGLHTKHCPVAKRARNQRRDSQE